MERKDQACRALSEVKRKLYQAVWGLASLRPIEQGKVIFVEKTEDHLTNSFLLLYRRVKKENRFTVHCHFLCKNRISRSENLKRELAFLRDAATAEYIVVNDTHDVFGLIRKRNGQHILNTWHGCGAFKRFGYASAESSFGMCREELEKDNLHPVYDTVSVSSPEVVWAYVEAMGLEDCRECVKPLGVSRTDVFFSAGFRRRSKESVLGEIPAAAGKKIMLYAPTFRGEVAEAKAPDRLDLFSLKERFSGEYILLLKYHPFCRKRPEIPSALSDFAFDVTDLPIDRLLCAADLCISDYSSCIFEYSLLGRPMLFFVYDLDDYFQERGFFYPFEELAPGPVCRTNEELADAIAHLNEWFDPKKVAAFREKFMSACDGHATDRIYEDFFGVGAEASTVSGVRNFARFATRKILLPGAYRLGALAPLRKGKIVFAETTFPQMTNSFCLLYDRLSANPDLDVRVHFFEKRRLSKMDALLRELSFMRDCGNAGYIVLNESYDTFGAIPKRRGQKILNTWHACGAFKRFGKSTGDDRFGGTKNGQDRYPLNPDCDLVTVSSPQVVWAYADAMKGEVRPENIRPIGVSRTDIFFDETFRKKAKEKLLMLMPEAEGKKVILYAPTFRGTVREAHTPNMLDISLLARHFSEEYVLLLNYHPHSQNRPQAAADIRSFAQDMTGRMTIDELLCVTDVCISDYSSVIFEFSLFEKPMLFFAYDLEDYFDSRGFYYDYDRLTPGPVCQTNEELVSCLEELSDGFDPKQVKAFREYFMSSCDGHATDRILEGFFGSIISGSRL